MQSLAFLSPRKRFVVTGLGVFFTLFLYLLFPTDDRFNPAVQSLILGTAFFLIVPVLFTKYVLKDQLSLMGFSGSSRRFGWLSVVLLAIPAMSILVLLSRVTPLGEEYSLPIFARDSFWMFALYEIIVVGAIVFLYEVFFRGFVQILWFRDYGWWAAFVQVAIFVAFFLLVEESLSWQMAPVLVASLFSGFVAAYTRSIWYSWTLSWLILFLGDAYFLVVG